MKRRQITDFEIETAMDILRHKMQKRLRQKGRGTFASRHEALGSITEEYHELEHAVQDNSMKKFVEECTDVAVGAVFSIACAKAKALDW